ncbi:MAG TPA: SIMPL domain-containing protein [Stellaceae bacterium]|nr:SIMPL domain-containing protein [Stellaceae bacterium]
MTGFGWIAGRLIVPLWLVLAALSPARAQTPLPAGDQSILHLSETAQRDVPRDLLRATLAAEATDPDAGKVQAAINRLMTAALARIKQVPAITVETGGYNVYQDASDKAGPGKAPARWHGSQSIALAAMNFDALLTLIGTLQQQGLVVQDLAPDLSRAARQSVEDSLTDEALARLQRRADRVAAALGTKVLRFRKIDVGSVAPPPIRPMLMRAAVAAASAPMPPPVAEPGSAAVSIAVDADVVLAPR